ncbi:MAG: hypothetical protein DRR08_26585 [Candidatus Parabeggiatoa sp. nov. 2]|nr:MAG: hypothetical protein B6247_25540 [Beggiatoa sp. 4572_84]RKZ54312.1 MAG: hypothetical protein DRR08_26585 [Gammaproteobacteria bacterium]
MNHFLIQLLCIFLVTSLFSTNASADVKPLHSFTPHAVASLKWGQGMGQVALSKAPANNFGPQSFVVGNGAVYLLDSANKRIVVIHMTNMTFSSIPLPSDKVDDFCMVDRNRFYLLFADEMKLVLYLQAGQRMGRVVKTLPIRSEVTPIGLNCLSKDKVIVETTDGLNSAGGNFVKRDSASQWTLRFNSKSHKSQVLSVKSRRGSVEFVKLIGVDQKNNRYLSVEELVDEGLTTEKVFRALRKYTPSGEWVAEVELPESLYAYTLKELVVAPSGDVYQLIPLPKGLEVVKWRMSRGGFKSFRGHSRYQQTLFSYPQSQPEDFEPSEAPAEENASFEKRGSTKGWGNKVTRQEIIRAARKYVRHKFYVNDANLTRRHGEEMGGKVVITPFSTPGNKIGVPYKWGGNDNLRGFQRGLNYGKKAGDKCTAKHRSCRRQYSGSSGAVGIDCSGLISQVWGLSHKYSTRNLPSISTQLRSMNDLQAGDIINKRGHVRLFSHKVASGRFFVYEASSKDWKVSGRFYRLSQLKRDRYKPYRYKRISGIPGTDGPVPPENRPVLPVRLHIFGDLSIAEKQSSAYTAKVVYSDGTTREVTQQVRWTVKKSQYAYFIGSRLYAQSVNQDQSVHVNASYTEKDRSLTQRALVTIRNQDKPKPVAPAASVTVRFWLNSPDQTQFSTHDRVIFYYQINSPRHHRLYFTLFNVSPAGKWAILLNNEAIEAGQLYSLPKTRQDWRPGQLFRRDRRLRLEAGREHFKAIVTSAPIAWTRLAAEKADRLPQFLGTAELTVEVN